MGTTGHLTEIEEISLRHFLAVVKERFGEDYLGGALFGSKARGDFHHESDLDIALFLRIVDGKIKRAIYDIAADEFLETEVEISPLVFQKDSYERMKAEGWPIATEIERDKVLL